MGALARLERADAIQPDLDRAWRTVDALGGRWEEPRDPERQAYCDGYDQALEDAAAAIEKLGGRPS